MKFIFSILTTLLFTVTFAQSNNPEANAKHRDSVNIITGFRVYFKARPKTKEIFNLYKNYLYSEPGSENNPYWNNAEKEKYRGYDFSAASIYGSRGLNFQYIKDYMDIYILSIEKLNDDLYSISAQYQFKGGLKNDISIWCTQRVSAVKENGEWKLQNNIVHYTRNWKTYHAGSIDYHYSCNYPFDTEVANKAGHFYNSLLKTYNLKPLNKKPDYYLASSLQELGELKGFDYFGAGFTTGSTSISDGYILSSKTPFHAHELVHLAFSTDNVKRNYLVEEGCSDFLGSRLYDSKLYISFMNQLCNDIQNNSAYTIENLITQSDKVPWNGYNYKYPFGALLCKMVYEHNGVKGLRKLMFTNTRKTNQLISTLCDLLDIKSKKDLFKEIKMEAIEEGN